ncbi:decaprenyl-phosphate phosphoribosyltransferase [Dehalococcoidia bacterium]|nr:decaprenyl-phosphate phosphoribosyltransferase [Dehalococcoidia bacterium]
MSKLETPSVPLPALGTSKAVLISARPKQWTKNLLVFLALIFSFNEGWSFSDAEQIANVVQKSALVFILFCALSSAVYIFNDITDIEKDRIHPIKKLRPIASGRLSLSTAWLTAIILTAVSLILSLVTEPLLGSVSAGYTALMVLYSRWTKNVVLLDVFSISGGFVLRAVAGAVALTIPISLWLYSCTSLGALLIALGKRRSELSIAGDFAPDQRVSLQSYSLHLIDKITAIVAPLTLLTYTLYALTASNLPDNHAMALTIPFVVFGLFRYLFMVYKKNLGEAPEDIFLTDIPLILSNTAWIVTASTILIIYRA